MLHRAAAALPYDDRARATTGLFSQLRVMARAADATPDWTTLVISGPIKLPGLRGERSFEWIATVQVEVDGGHFSGDASTDSEPVIRLLTGTQPLPIPARAG
jgi:hypothetical protein